MGSLATREAPGGSSRDQGGTEQKFVGWFLSVCELRGFGPVAGWRESNAAHTAGRPVPSRAAEARPHAPKSGARLFMSINIFISVTPFGTSALARSPITHTSMVPKRSAPETGARL